MCGLITGLARRMETASRGNCSRIRERPHAGLYAKTANFEGIHRGDAFTRTVYIFTCGDLRLTYEGARSDMLGP